MKLCVYGAGAIGGLIGVQLARAGIDVSLVARGAHLAAMQANGLRLQIGGEERVERLRCSDDAAELGPQDFVVIALKAHAIAGAVDAMRPLVGADTTVVTASNGLPYWFFCEPGEALFGAHLDSVDPGGRQWKSLGPGRALGCVVFPAAEMIAPGVIRHEHGLKFPIGEPRGGRSERVLRFHDAMTAGGFDAPIREDIRDEIWLKLWGNLCFNPVSALTLATIDQVTADPGTRAVCRTMMTEAKAIGERLGVHLRVGIESRIDGAHALGAHKMSMLQDLERGREMELEPVVAVVQELGKRVGVATPAIDVVLALLRLRARQASLPT